MKRFFEIFKVGFCFLILTVFTQIGGLVYLINRMAYKWTDSFSQNNFVRNLIRYSGFIVLYVFTTFILVPPMAKFFGRERLPLAQSGFLRPHNFITCLLNRNYVRPELKASALEAASNIQDQFPGTVINYLEAGFPFFNGYPLWPHRSHNDGKKLDISFFYRKAVDGSPSSDCPSRLGYGICEEPQKGEKNWAEICSRSNNGWQYSLLRKYYPQGRKADFVFDPKRTTMLVKAFTNQPRIQKVFIEPHLQKRMGLNSPKIRLHGCGAVRHDDHLHVEIR